MARIVFCICLTVAALSGCIVVDTPSSGGRDSGAAYNAPPTQAQPDNRTFGDLGRENSLLRPQLAKLEEQHRIRLAAVEKRQDEISELKRQRNELKKERDRYRKALKEQDD